MSFADTARFPGENAETAMRRRITMHEFLMTGGVQLGLDSKMQMQYSEPIGLAELAGPQYTDCPWHPGQDCAAWEMIRSGSGHWTAKEQELQDVLADLEQWVIQDGDEAQNDLLARVTALQEELELRPRQVRNAEQPSRAQKPERDRALEKKIAKQRGHVRAHVIKGEQILNAEDVREALGSTGPETIEFDNDDEGEG